VRVMRLNPNAKSSTGMSQGNRMPLACWGAYTTMGALSLVSQPSTSTWKPRTMRTVSQYAGRRNTCVRRTRSSRATTTGTDMAAATVYSGMRTSPLATSGLRATPLAATAPKQGADGLVGEEGAQRYDDEEHQLLDRDSERQARSRGVARAVVPMSARDRDRVPDEERDDHEGEDECQPARPAVDPGTEHELQRQGDGKAGGHEQEVLVAVDRSASPVVVADVGAATRGGPVAGGDVGIPTNGAVPRDDRPGAGRLRPDEPRDVS
jgi:hypothetical protein